MHRLKRNQLKQIVAPGIWIDQEDGLHVSLPEVCQANGLPPTTENLEIARQVAVEFFHQEGAATIIHREKPD